MRDQKKRVGSVTVLLDASARTFYAGPRVEHLRQVKLKPHEAGAAGRAHRAGRDHPDGGLRPLGRVLIRQIAPLPMTILGVIPNVELGG